MSIVQQSIHELEPLEVGGTIARRGFDVQDHVAAGFCLDMVTKATLGQVWTESQDDVFLLWINGATEEVEFVQVKSNELDQLWTIAELLRKEAVADEEDDTSGNGKPKKSKKKEGRCILEKSLQYDRCNETVRFRIVTCRPVKDELNFLTHELGSPHRDKTKPDYAHLLTKIKERIGDFKSQNGRGCEFWLDRTYWEWVHDRESITNVNVIKTMRLVQLYGQYMALDQARELYQRLLRKVYEGGLANWKREQQKKKFLRADIISWLAQAIDDAVHPARFGTGKKLEEKLRDASIPSEDHEAAAQMRLQYRLEGLSPKYAESTQKRNVENEIAARLLSLRANLDGGLIDESGAAFHARCLNAIDEIHKSLPEKDRPPIQNLYGYMYNLADRCTHRFVRAKV